MFIIFAADTDLRGSKLQEESSVDLEDFTTKYDGFSSQIKYIDYRNATKLKTTSHTYPDFMMTFSRLINEIDLCYEISAKQIL